jgi:hypothetical protein
VDSITASEALGALAVMGLGVIIRQLSNLNGKANAQGERLVRVETVLTGANGSNGLSGDVKHLKATTHRHGEDLHEVRGKMQVYEIQLEALDRRNGPDDRRSPA